VSSIPFSPTLCSMPDCVRPVRSRGYCLAHYTRLRRGQDLSTPLHKTRLSPLETCSTEGCNLLRYCKSLCIAHYERQRRGTDSTAPVIRRYLTLQQYLETHSERLQNSCLLWKGQISRTGYGIMPKTKTYLGSVPHKVAYILAYGEIPTHKELHHICENRACIEPTHLIPVDRRTHRRLHPRACYVKRGPDGRFI
jgi:HNH endonuclease